MRAEPRTRGRTDLVRRLERSGRCIAVGGSVVAERVRALRLLRREAEEVVGISDTLHRELDVGNAIRLGLSLCKPGDVLIFACGSSLQVFVDAIRVTDPESADLIAAQTA